MKLVTAWIATTLCAAALAAGPGCSKDSSGSAGGDGDTDADADTDTDVDSDTDSDTEVCDQGVYDGSVTVNTPEQLSDLMLKIQTGGKGKELDTAKQWAADNKAVVDPWFSGASS